MGSGGRWGAGGAAAPAPGPALPRTPGGPRRPAVPLPRLLPVLLLALACAGGTAGNGGPDGGDGAADARADLPPDGLADAARDPGADAPAPPDAADAGPDGSVPGDEGLPGDPGAPDPDAPAADAPAADAPADPDAPPDLALLAVEPAEGPAGAPTTVTVRGAGFEEGLEVFFGDRKGLYPFVISATLANVTAPPADAGAVDVRAVLPDGRAAALPAAFRYRGSLAVAAVDPPRGPAGGGTPVTIRGSGLLDVDRVLVGGRAAPVVRAVDDRTLLAVTPPGDTGPAALILLAGDASARLPDAFEYQDDPWPPSRPTFTVRAADPAEGPPAGGTVVELSGTGFLAGASVRVGALPATDVQVLDGTRIRLTTPPGSPGPARIVVRQGFTGAVGEGLFRYVEPGGPALWAVDPAEGSWAGGTRVRLHGANLQGVRQVFFGNAAATAVQVVDDTRVEARTPRAAEAGLVPVMVLGDGGALSPPAFAYFDPRLPGGGTWGGPLRDALNVTVIDGFTGRGLADATVIVGDDLHTPYQARTDSRGQATLSEWGFRGPVSLTAAKAGYTAATYAGFDARNATLYVSPQGSPESPSLPPGSLDPADPCRVRGRVKDYGKYLVKPSWVEGNPWVRCEASGTSLFGGAPDPGPGGTPDADGRFDLVARSGTFAVICQMLVLDPQKGWAVPLRAGIARNLSCGSSKAVEGVVVSLDTETDADLWVATGVPPSHPSGANDPYYVGGFELGQDGWWNTLSRADRRGDRVLFPAQPRSFQGDFAGRGYSFYVTSSAKTSLGLPYSTVLDFQVPPPEAWWALVEDPSGFQPVPAAPRREVTALAPLPDGRLLAADSGGGTWEWDGTAFHVGPWRTSRPVLGLWAAGEGDFWAVGARGMARHVVAGQATDVPTNLAVDLRAVWGDGEGGLSVAGGTVLLRLDGDRFLYENLPAGVSDLRAVRRFAGGALVAVGAGGAVVTGTSGQPLGVVRPDGRDLRALDCLDAAACWAAGAAGSLVRVTPDEVTAVTVPGAPDFRGVVALGSDHVLAFGSDGAVFRWDGTRFTDHSRPDLGVDLTAGASAGGRVVLAGRRVVRVPGFLPFPEFLEPVDQQPWGRRRLAWALGAAADASYVQALLSGGLGGTFWNVMAGGDVREVLLPDLFALLGESPIPAGAKRINLTAVRSPGFDIDAFGSGDLSYTDREAFSVGLASFP